MTSFVFEKVLVKWSYDSLCRKKYEMSLKEKCYVAHLPGKLY